MWVVTADLVDDGDKVGKWASEDYLPGNLEELQFGFDIFDDEGNILYSGRSDDNTDTEPLDYFAQDYGGVEIKFVTTPGGMYIEDMLAGL